MWAGMVLQKPGIHAFPVKPVGARNHTQFLHRQERTMEIQGCPRIATSVLPPQSLLHEQGVVELTSFSSGAAIKGLDKRSERVSDQITGGY